MNAQNKLDEIKEIKYLTHLYIELIDKNKTLDPQSIRGAMVRISLDIQELESLYNKLFKKYARQNKQLILYEYLNENTNDYDLDYEEIQRVLKEIEDIKKEIGIKENE